MASTIKDTVNNLLDKLHISGGEDQAPVAEPSEQEIKELREKYEKAQQDQVLAFYDELSAPEKASLFQQLQNIDVERANKLAEEALHPAKSSGDDKPPQIEPLPDASTASLLDASADDTKKWYEQGLEQVANNRVGVVLMAGGQGTRLGSSDPKGCFNIDLPSQKSLFQIQAERIWKVQQLAEKRFGKSDVVVPWYVMTSGPTRGPTEKFFKDNKYFGLDEKNVLIFEQGVLPCISNEGEILMESKSKVCSLGLVCVFSNLCLGCSSPRRQRRHLPGARTLKRPHRYAETRYRACPRLLR